MMLATDNITVREIAANSLAAVRVFEQLGIDYCCGGKRPLDEVCKDKGLDTAAVRREIEAAEEAGSRGPDRDWNLARLSELIAHIVDVHHSYLRRELPAVQTRVEKVYRVYNERYGPTLTGLPEVFGALKEELESHMLKEEMVLFPAVQAIEAGVQLPASPCGGLANPIRVMEFEHENAGQALARIREITGDFSVPEHACVTYRALMSSLAELERDLHLHIHLENNILFPGAQKLEASRG